MIRLVIFIIIFVVFLGFIVLNLQNTSDLSFGFITLENVPVFLSVLCSFMLGMLFSIPLAFSISWKRHAAYRKLKKAEKEKEKSTEAPIAIEDSTAAEIEKNKSAYGID